MTTIALGSQISAGSFNFYSDGSVSPLAHKIIYPVDINGDGVDEIFFAGFETQPNTPSAYSNTSIHIFGWQNGKLQEITNQWLPNNTNQVEGVGDIAFGDFNADGLVDAYISGNADMEYTINAYALMNKGTYFEKINLGPTQWEHSVAAGDINLDGFSDIVVAGYSHPSIFLLGGANGLTKHLVLDDQAASFNINSYETHGSGVAIADFLGDGGVSVVIADSAASDGPSDTRLLSVVNNAQGVPIGFRYIATLPIPRLELPKYNNLANGQYDNSHDVRADPFDFTHDGLMDVIVFSRGGHNGHEWPEISEVQFLKNLGSGVFEDVTETVLVGYEHDNCIGYNPIIADFNNDGFEDIFIGESDYSTSNSTVLLMQHANGTFVETARSQLSALIPTGNNLSSIAKGPEGNYYTISEISANNNGGLNSIYANKITFIENRAPALTKSLADVSVNEGKSISYSISAAFKDPDNADTLTYAVSLEGGAALPNWFSFNTSTKKLIGTLPYNVDVNFSVKVIATDQDGLSVADIFSVNTKNVSDIKGTNAANTIVAGIGNDSINGGLGNDTLTGGDGNDTFVFNTKLGATNVDTLTDFASGDKIVLAGSVFTKLKGDKDLSDNFALESATTIKQYLIYNPTTGKLYYDADGSATKSAPIEVAIIGVDSHASLTVNDFTIV